MLAKGSVSITQPATHYRVLSSLLSTFFVSFLPLFLFFFFFLGLYVDNEEIHGVYKSVPETKVISRLIW